MFRTAARLAHEARTPLLRFPTRAARQNPPHHAPSPHPCAPQAAIDSFPAFLARLQGSSSGRAAPKSGSKLPQAELEGEWELPARFSRGAYSPSEAEIEAVESGGATAAPVVTKATKEKWYTAQV